MKKIKRKSTIKLKSKDWIVLRGGLKLENVGEVTFKIPDFTYYHLTK